MPNAYEIITRSVVLDIAGSIVGHMSREEQVARLRQAITLATRLTLDAVDYQPGAAVSMSITVVSLSGYTNPEVVATLVYHTYGDSNA